MGAAAVALLLISSCKPSEKAYREAYETTMEARRAAQANDSIKYTPLASNHKILNVASGSDTIQVIHMPVSVLKGGGGIRESLKSYSVVVGQFKQVFNAKQMRERIVGRGYPGAFVVRTGEPRYLVISASVPTVAEASEQMKKVVADTATFRFHAPVPYILSRRSR